MGLQGQVSEFVLVTRHSRESENPEGSPHEIKYKQQPADPSPFMGLQGQVSEFVLVTRHSRESGNPEG